MEPRTTAPARHFDPAHWEFRVRRADGTWLARPAPDGECAKSNAETWTRRIPDGWSFNSHGDARRAAIAHGIDPGGFAVIPAPRRGGEWLKGEGAYAAA